MTYGFIFDIDGTLIDSVDLHALTWQKTLAHFGFEIPYEDVRSQIGKGGDQLLPVFVPPGQLERLKDRIEHHRGELFRRDYLPGVRPFPRVRELFERIKRDGHRIALASSAKSDEISIYKNVANIVDLTDVETSRDDVDCSKPCPDVFEVALGGLRMAPECALVFGDSPYDAIAAVRAGLTTIGVRCGGFPERWLRDSGCVAIYRDPSDLLDHYDELRGYLTPAPRTL